jgi:hypothetical protein
MSHKCFAACGVVGFNSIVLFVTDVHAMTSHYVRRSTLFTLSPIGREKLFDLLMRWKPIGFYLRKAYGSMGFYLSR